MPLMKSGLLGALMFVLLSSSKVSGLESVLVKSYPQGTSPMTWNQAQDHCRRSHTDLAVFYDQADVNSLYLGDYYAWIGLYREESPSGVGDWTWTGGTYTHYVNWAPGEPEPQDRCAMIHYTSKQIYGAGCGTYFFFFCQYTSTHSFLQLLSVSSFVSLSMTWAEAREYCRDRDRDLMSSLYNMNWVTFPAWVGLHREEGTWKWSLGSSDYRRWGPSEAFDHDCVKISSTTKLMETRSCSERFPFVCVSDNLVLVRQRKTWEEALEHCRAMSSPTDLSARYDLVSVQPGHDQDYMMARVEQADTQEVWVGLRFLAGAWLWMTGADLSYPDLPLCPIGWRHCGVLTKSNSTSVETKDCAERRNFLCYRK